MVYIVVSGEYIESEKRQKKCICDIHFFFDVMVLVFYKCWYPFVVMKVSRWKLNQSLSFKLNNKV